MGNPKFTEEQKKEIKEKREAGATIMALAVEYNTSLSTITRMVNEKYAENVRKLQNARYHRQKEEFARIKAELEELRGKRDEDTSDDK